jgi:hypothetical protein
MCAAVESLNINHRFIWPDIPKTNGKAERFIQTSLREWAYDHSGQRLEHLSFCLHNDNWHRPHHRCLCYEQECLGVML